MICAVSVRAPERSSAGIKKAVVLGSDPPVFLPPINSYIRLFPLLLSLSVAQKIFLLATILIAKNKYNQKR